MTKVVGIETGKKPDVCLYCGADPAHAGLSCPRIKAAELYEDGSLAFVEFFESKPPVARS